MPEVHFSREEVREIALGQQEADALQAAVDAFNGFAGLFGRPWMVKVVEGVQSAWLVRWISSLWADWLQIRDLPKADKLLERWRRDMQAEGVLNEVRIFARLSRAGAALELFPDVGTRMADCRFKAAPDEPWVYVEGSQRGISEVRRQGEDILREVSTAAGGAAPGLHGKVAILRIPTADEVNQIVRWLQSHPSNGERLEDLAEFYTDVPGSAIDKDDILEQRIPDVGGLYSTHLVFSGGTETVRGTARLSIDDTAGEKVLREEAAQLPQGEPGIVVLNVSKVIGGYEAWRTTIARRLRPDVHTRVSAVVLVQTLLSDRGPQTKGEIIINQYARRGISEQAFQTLQTILNDSHLQEST